MDQPTRYRYEQKIRNLEMEVTRLKAYRELAYSVLTCIGEVVGEGKSISTGWIIRQFADRVLK